MLKILRLFLVIAYVIFLSGCASLATAPEKEQLAKFDKAFLVPLEDLPVSVGPEFNYVLPGVGGSLQYTQAAGIFNTLSVLAQMPNAFKRAEMISKTLDKNMNAKETWQPTRQLSAMAADYIKTNGKTVSIAEKPLKLPNQTSTTINHWYNDNGPIAEYRSLPASQSTFVLEIEAGASILSGDILLEIRMKLIDPATGKVIGRNREWETVDLPEVEETFKDNGRVYKATYLSTGQKLIRESLAYYGLIMEE
ncbi:MAG: hypothetical protein IPN42_08105 [Methylococcaceae bacterium]|nr:hypothetical protein [Methylococcaceae bacterium]